MVCLLSLIGCKLDFWVFFGGGFTNVDGRGMEMVRTCLGVDVGCGGGLEYEKVTSAGALDLNDII